MFKILTLLLSLSLTTFSQTTQDQYSNALADVNDFLEKEFLNDGFLKKCPGVKLVKTCGNKVCETFNNETVSNCPADCLPNVTVRSYNSITLCDKYTQTHIPNNVEEIQDIIKMANFKNLKVKPIGASHSATDIMCSEGILIPTRQFNKVIGLGKINKKQIVEVESGVTVFELSEWLHKRGYALEGLPHMGFRDVTIGGSMATGSHGSSTKHSGVISNIVQAIEFVDGLGEVHYLERINSNQDEFKALSTSLGLLGVVTKVKLGIQKQFNLAVKVTHHKESEMLKNGLINQVKDCDYGQLNWFPSVRKFAKTCGKITKRKAFRNANNVLLSPKIPKFIINPFKQVLQLGTCNNGFMGLVERVRYWSFKLNPPLTYRKRRRLKKSNYVVGPSHRMVSSHLTKAQDGLFQMDWELAVPASKAQEALLAIRNHMNENRTKLPLVGVFIRFAPSESNTLMAHTVSDGKDWIEGEPAVFFEMPVFIPVGFSAKRFAAYEKQFVDFAKMLIEKYSARPHWGKNRDWTFSFANNQNSYPHLNKFKRVRDKFDPNNIFSNKFSQSLGIK